MRSIRSGKDSSRTQANPLYCLEMIEAYTQRNAASLTQQRNHTHDPSSWLKPCHGMSTASFALWSCQYRTRCAPVIDGLAQDGHVVRVQHAMHEADALPRRDQPCRALHHLRQQRRVLLVLPC